jgi:hypothetical protein
VTFSSFHPTPQHTSHPTTPYHLTTAPFQLSLKTSQGKKQHKRSGDTGGGRETTLVRVNEGGADLGEYILLKSADSLLSLSRLHNCLTVEWGRRSLKTQPRRPWYGVATISRLLKIMRLFCRITSLL